MITRAPDDFASRCTLADTPVLSRPQHLHRWSGRAGEYQRLFEPVEIAKWYGRGIHREEGRKHYIDQLDRLGDADKRPGRFNRIDRHVKQSSVDEALSKAKDYKQNWDNSGGKCVLSTAQPAAQSQRRRWWWGASGAP